MRCSNRNEVGVYVTVDGGGCVMRGLDVVDGACVVGDGYMVDGCGLVVVVVVGGYMCSGRLSSGTRCLYRSWL